MFSLCSVRSRGPRGRFPSFPLRPCLSRACYSFVPLTLAPSFARPPLRALALMGTSPSFVPGAPASCLSLSALLLLGPFPRFSPFAFGSSLTHAVLAFRRLSLLSLLYLVIPGPLLSSSQRLLLCLPRLPCALASIAPPAIVGCPPLNGLSLATNPSGFASLFLVSCPPCPRLPSSRSVSLCLPWFPWYVRPFSACLLFRYYRSPRLYVRRRPLSTLRLPCVSTRRAGCPRCSLVLLATPGMLIAPPLPQRAGAPTSLIAWGLPPPSSLPWSLVCPAAAFVSSCAFCLVTGTRLCAFPPPPLCVPPFLRHSSCGSGCLVWPPAPPLSLTAWSGRPLALLAYLPARYRLVALRLPPCACRLPVSSALAWVLSRPGRCLRLVAFAPCSAHCGPPSVRPACPAVISGPALFFFRFRCWAPSASIRLPPPGCCM